MRNSQDLVVDGYSHGRNGTDAELLHGGVGVGRARHSTDWPPWFILHSFVISVVDP